MLLPDTCKVFFVVYESSINTIRTLLFGATSSYVNSPENCIRMSQVNEL